MIYLFTWNMLLHWDIKYPIVLLIIIPDVELRSDLFMAQMIHEAITDWYPYSSGNFKKTDDTHVQLSLYYEKL